MSRCSEGKRRQTEFFGLNFFWLDHYETHFGVNVSYFYLVIDESGKSGHCMQEILMIFPIWHEETVKILRPIRSATAASHRSHRNKETH